MNPETLKAMKEAADNSVRLSMTTVDRQTQWQAVLDFLPFMQHVSALIAEVERQAGEIERLRHERDEFGNAIAEVSIKAGIIDGRLPLDGPQLLSICGDLANERERCAEIIQRELNNSEGKGIDFEDLVRIKHAILKKGNKPK